MDTIKFLSWNVEHFKMNKTQQIADIIKSYNPDVFGIYEVEAKEIYSFMLSYFPDYSIFITEGQESQEILIACSNRMQTIKFQQKREFQSGNLSLRPGAFLTFKYPAQGLYNFLFLHTDSGSGPVDFGNRTEMFEHAYNLKRKLDFDNPGQSVNFIMLGDLNTMGLEYPKPYETNEIAQTQTELAYLDFYAKRGSGTTKSEKLSPKLRRLIKPIGTLYSKTYGIADLDHIIVSDHLNFTKFGNDEVKLDGWIKYKDNPVELKKFTDQVSDHCLLYCELLVNN
jgi:exonuclease III